AAAAKPALTAGTAHQCGFHKAAPAARATAAASHAGSGKRAGENASSVATNAAAMTAAAGRRVALAASTTAASAQRMASAFDSNTSPPTHAPSPIMSNGAQTGASLPPRGSARAVVTSRTYASSQKRSRTPPYAERPAVL